jgi:hypothetical protein
MAKVLAWSNMPTRLPLIPSMVFYLFLDHFKAPGWIWGAACVLIGFIWLVAIIGLFTQEQVDVIKDYKPRG